MYDIEASIQGWRRTLLAREGMLAEHADELEDHLRAEFDRLRGAALSEEEAFLIASHRLGRTDAIAEEFARVDPGATWRRRWIWMLCGYLVLGATFSLITFAATIAFAVVHGAPAFLSLGVYSAVLLLGVAGVVFLARWASRASAMTRLGTALSRRLRTTTGIVGFGLVVIASQAAVSYLFGPVLWSRVTSVGSGAAWIRFMSYPQVALWLAPIVALAILVRLDRARDRSEEAQSAGGR